MDLYKSAGMSELVVSEDRVILPAGKFGRMGVISVRVLELQIRELAQHAPFASKSVGCIST